MKEYKRSCNKCGAIWYVPKELAEERMPNKLEIAGTKMQTFGMGSLEGVGRHARAQLKSLEARKQRVLDNARCPSCGSSDYSQARGW